MDGRIGAAVLRFEVLFRNVPSVKQKCCVQHGIYIPSEGFFGEKVIIYIYIHKIIRK